MANNRDRFIVESLFDDGRPCYFTRTSLGDEWHEDRRKAKVYKLRTAAQAIVDKYDRGKVVKIGEPVVSLKDALNHAMQELRDLCETHRYNTFDDVMTQFPPTIRKYLTVDQSPVYWDKNDYDPTNTP